MAKILIAEDDRDIRELVELALGFSGYIVTGVGDGRLAVKEATQNRYDLILLDVNMPRMSGYEVCSEIRKNELNGKTPVLILSVGGQDEERQRGFDAGANGYVIKPFAPDTLVQMVKNLLIT